VDRALLQARKTEANLTVWATAGGPWNRRTEVHHWKTSDEYDIPEAELVQFWLDLYGERDASSLRGPVTKDDLCAEPEVEWELAVQGYSWEQHSAGDILEVLAELGCYDPNGDYGREEDAIRAAVIIAERNAPEVA